MKFLKYFFALILILGLLFILKGVITPKISYESEVTVNKPIQEAWAVMMDESKVSQWVTGVKKIEPISGAPNTVGAKAKIYVEDRGKEILMEETITAIKPNEHLAMNFTMDMMKMDYDMFLSENNGKTTIRSKSVTEGEGMIAKSMISFMTGSMKTQETENLNKLKKVIEENTTNYFPKPELEVTEETSK